MSIGFSTGTIWRWMKSGNRNELINYLRELNISAVELAVGSREELYSLRLSDENILWLRNLTHVSIHAPAFSRIDSSISEVKKQLKIIEDLSILLNIKSVVIHPADMPPPEVLSNYSFPVSIENIGPENYTTSDYLNEWLSMFPSLGLCLDLSHAALVSENEANKLVSLFGDRISHIHFSGINNGKDHQSLFNASPEFYRSIECVKDLKVPFIIEEDIEEYGIAYLKKELKLARKLSGVCHD